MSRPSSVMAWKIAASAALLMASANHGVHASYLGSDAARAFMVEMQERHAFPEATLQRIFAAAERKDSILKAMSRPAERTLEWKDYRKIFMTEDRVRLGKAFMDKHAPAFERAEKEMGVPRHVIAAIIGVETRYGRVTGGHRVIDALATLAFDYPPRADFFRGELEQFLLLTREQAFDPLQLKGSYAGAMGYGQFIPSSYRNYAIDFDGDGVANILDNPVDAIGSVANYFVGHGWRSGEPVVEQVGMRPGLDALIHDGLQPQFTLDDFRKTGLQPAASLGDNAPARLLRLVAEDGEQWWLTYHNFYVITRYNHSSMYAMAVYELSQALKAADATE